VAGRPRRGEGGAAATKTSGRGMSASCSYDDAAKAAPTRSVIERNPLPGYGTVIGFTLLNGGLIAVHGGSLSDFVFPVSAGIAAAILFRYHRAIYFAFTWWLWLFAPEVRRLADYQSVYHDVSPIIITPLLVTGLAVAPFFSAPRALLGRRMAPFMALALVYAVSFVIGAVSNGPLPACYDFANNLLPLLFGLLLMLDEPRHAENRRALIGAMMPGLLLVSLYGMYQFYDFPAWDQFWLTASKFGSAGLGEADQVRLFGTLNSPGPYGFVLMASLVFALVSRGAMRNLAGAFGVPALGLSLVRTAWGGGAMALLFIMLFARGRLQLRVIIACMTVAVLATPLLMVAPVEAALTKRLATFNNIQQDGSYQSRAYLYQNFTASAFSEPIGIGFGGNGAGTKLAETSTNGFDSGFLQIPYQFGWVFGALFCWALIVLMLRALAAALRRDDNIRIAAAGMFLTMIALNAAAPMFAGVLGVITWGSLGIALGPKA